MLLFRDFSFKTQPFAHQSAAFERTRDLEAAALLMEMGTGKSKVLADTIAWNFCASRITGAMIIAPRSLTMTWELEQLPTHLSLSGGDCIQHRWAGGHTQRELRALQTFMKPEALSGVLRILIIHPDALRTKDGLRVARVFLDRFASLVGVDESTVFGSATAKQTKLLLREIRPRAKMRRILTGHPGLDTPLKVWSQFEFLRAGCLGHGTFTSFRARYCKLEKTRVAGGREVDTVVGYQRLDELRERVAEHAFVIRKSECLDLPEKLHTTRYVTMTPTQARLYSAMRDEMVASLTSGDCTAQLVLTQTLRLRQILSGYVKLDTGAIEAIEGGNPKMDAAIDAVEASDARTIVWGTFVTPLTELARQLEERGHRVGLITGAVPLANRQAFTQSFQRDDDSKGIDVIVAQVATAAHGVTWTRGTNVVYFDNDWSLERRLQSEDRSHRIGLRGAVLYTDVIARGTIEETIVQRLRDKLEVADEVIDPRRLALMLGAGGVTSIDTFAADA